MGYNRRCVFVLVGVILVTLLHHLYSGKGYQKQWNRSSGSSWENQVSPNPGTLLVGNNMVADGPKNAEVKPKPVVSRMTTPIWVNTNNHSNEIATSVPTWVKTDYSRLLNRSTIATPAWVKVPYRVPFYVTSTYLDRRRNRFGQAVVVLGYGELNQSEQPIYCLFSDAKWSEMQCTKDPLVKIQINDKFRKSENKYCDYYYICKVSSLFKPAFVSFSSNHTCQQPSTWITVAHGLAEPTKKFGVCIHSPLFMNDPQYIIHTFEMNRILGAEWFTVYILGVSTEVKKVLKDYSDEGLLETVDWNIPHKIGAHYHGQNMCIQDCAYRNMHRVKYLIYTDLDEIIVPQQHPNWSEMMEKLDQELRGAFIFRMVHLYGNSTKGTCNTSKSEFKVPRFITFTQRSEAIKAEGTRSKLIVKPKRFGRIGVHKIFELLKGYQPYNVSPEVALVYHYRVPPLYTSRTRKEDKLVKYSSELLARIQARICL